MSIYNYIFKYIIYIIILLFFILFLIIGAFFIFNNRSYFKIKKILNDSNKIEVKDKLDIIDKPLKEFYINSSHNSYISNLQNGSILFNHTVSNVLKMGARCIEIDIHNRYGNPVVAHGTADILSSTTLPLSDVFDEIVLEGFKTSDPLILYLEILTDDPCVMMKINKLLKEKFDNKRLDKKYRMDYNDVDKGDLINTPIKDLLNKIIIVNATGYNNGLEDVLDDSRNFHNQSTNDILKIDNNSIKRVYLDGSFLSMMSNNFDPEPYWSEGVNMIVLNFNSYEPYLYKNLNFFKNCNFRHFSEK